ncbi:PfkB family carbohydrate kinase [Paenibacillus elgii]|uniref:PfkB family carbohydrate kinase n=1 Tax=Paenibacillus elgii TaxID=189691 RepID=UPI0030D8A0C1
MAKAGSDGTKIRVPAFQVATVDTTTTGDTFIGALAAATHASGIKEEAMRLLLE